MTGCAGIVALVVLPVGVLMAMMIPEATLAARIAIALTPSAILFIVVMLLLMRDQWFTSRRARRIQRTLLNRHDVKESEYLAHFRDADPTLMSQIRQAISDFFEVPVEKIHPTDNLRNDLMFETFEPSFHLAVFYSVLAARRLEPVPSQFVSFNTADLITARDLANEVQRVIQSLKYS